MFDLNLFQLPKKLILIVLVNNNTNVSKYIQLISYRQQDMVRFKTCYFGLEAVLSLRAGQAYLQAAS